MDRGESLYMFAIVPPPGLSERIHKERILFAENYNCKKALKPPVHITLYPPFSAVENFITSISALDAWAGRQHGFDIQLKNFGFFNKRSPVIYIDVVRSAPLKAFQKDFTAQLGQYMPVTGTGEDYKPHITIGYRDIPRHAFPSIVNKYTHLQFHASFFADAFQLWKHDGTRWQTARTFSLQLK